MDPKTVAINECGFDLKKVRIVQVKISPHRGKWYVEYKRKNPRYWIFDKNWWYDDSVHGSYGEASVRANVLACTGYVEVIRPKKQEIIEVKTNKISDDMGLNV